MTITHAISPSTSPFLLSHTYSSQVIYFLIFQTSFHLFTFHPCFHYLSSHPCYVSIGLFQKLPIQFSHLLFAPHLLHYHQAILSIIYNKNTISLHESFSGSWETWRRSPSLAWHTQLWVPLQLHVDVLFLTVCCSHASSIFPYHTNFSLVLHVWLAHGISSRVAILSIFPSLQPVPGRQTHINCSLNDLIKQGTLFHIYII